MTWEEKYKKLIDEVQLLRDDMQYALDRPHPLDPPGNDADIMFSAYKDAYAYILGLAKEIGEK